MMKIHSLNLSHKKGEQKHSQNNIFIDKEGIVGDAHRGDGNRAISLLAQEEVDLFAKKIGRTLEPGEFAENITTSGLDYRQVALLDQLTLGKAIIEVSQIGKHCHNQSCAIFKQVGECIMPRTGIFGRVIQEGAVVTGDTLIHHPKTVRIKIITLSDRASKGQYIDQSGPCIAEMISEQTPKRWPIVLKTALIPDSEDLLKKELNEALLENIDVIISTGGTGVGPRDFTPQVVTPFCDYLIPGVMEAIRMKYGQDNPMALLSRSVVGVTGRTLIYTLPGSPRAVNEYMAEILKTMEHLILMLHGLGH